MAVGIKTGNGVETELVDAESEDVRDGYGALEDEPGLTVRYTTIEETGTTQMVIEGSFSTDITQVMVDGKVAFVSDAFGGQQLSLKKALDAAGRNTIARAVAAAYEAANPKPERAERTRAPRGAALTEATVAKMVADASEQAAEAAVAKFAAMLKDNK